MNSDSLLKKCGATIVNSEIKFLIENDSINMLKVRAIMVKDITFEEKLSICDIENIKLNIDKDKFEINKKVVKLNSDEIKKKYGAILYKDENVIFANSVENLLEYKTSEDLFKIGTSKSILYE